MADALQVFVEGCLDPSPDAVNRVAEGMAQRYGLPAADLAQRIARGRFRVKANLDRATALQYATDLTSIGANVVVVDGNTGVPVPVAQLQAAAAPKLAPVRPPQPKPPQSSSPLGAVGKGPVSGSNPAQSLSGLSAALSSASGPMDLGALGSDSASFALSALDGTEDAPEPAKAKAQNFGPAADAFAPPDEGGEQQITLIEDPAAKVQRESNLGPQHARASEPAIAAQPGGKPAEVKAPSVPLTKRLAQPRVKLAVGVALSILLGFLPASVIASIREAGASDDIDERVRKTQAAADTPNAWEGLDGMRATMLGKKKNAKHEIAVTSMVIWVVLGGGIAFGWFKKVPWQKFE